MIRNSKVELYIREYLKQNHYGPSYREIMQAVGLRSLSTVRRCLMMLKEEGRITFDPAIPRSVRLTEKEHKPEIRSNPEENYQRVYFELSDGGKLAFDFLSDTPVIFGGIVEHSSMKKNVTGIKRVVIE